MQGKKKLKSTLPKNTSTDARQDGEKNFVERCANIERGASLEQLLSGETVSHQLEVEL